MKFTKLLRLFLMLALLMTPFSTENAQAAAEKKLTRLSASPSKLNLTEGDLRELVITAHYSDGTREKVTSEAAWSSSASSVIQMRDTTAVALEPGKATIKASFSSGKSKKTVNIPVTVKERKPNLQLITDVNFEKVEKETGDTTTWIGFRLTDVDIYFTESALKQNRHFLQDANNVIAQMKQYFDTTKLPNRTKLFVYDNETKRDGWASFADYLSQKDIVRVNGSSYYPFLQGNPDDIRGAIAHEMTHAFQYQVMDAQKIRRSSDMAWLIEGQADYVTHQVVTYSELEGSRTETGFSRETYEKWLKTKEEEYDIDWDAYHEFTEEYMYGDYRHLEPIIYFLETTFGHDAFLEMMRGLQTKSVDEVARDVFGKSEADLVKEFKDYYDLK